MSTRNTTRRLQGILFPLAAILAILFALALAIAGENDEVPVVTSAETTPPSEKSEQAQIFEFNLKAIGPSGAIVYGFEMDSPNPDKFVRARWYTIVEMPLVPDLKYYKGIDDLWLSLGWKIQRGKFRFEVQGGN